MSFSLFLNFFNLSKNYGLDRPRFTFISIYLIGFRSESDGTRFFTEISTSESIRISDIRLSFFLKKLLKIKGYLI